MPEKIKLKMHDPLKVNCLCVALFEQPKRLLDTKQEDEEPLIECTKKFKQALDNVKSVLRIEWLEKFAESMEECMSETDSDAQKGLKSMSFETFMVCTHLRNCDGSKHGSLKKNFQTQHMLNNDQCLKKITGVSDALGSHQWDQACKNHLKKKKEQRKEN